MMDGATLNKLRGLRQSSFLVGVAGLGCCAAGAWFNARQFFISYLVAYLFWAGLALGCMGFLMVHHLAGGRWGYPVRRIFEAAMMTLPLVAVQFVPVCFGMRELYAWMNPGVVLLNPAMLHRAAYMTPAWFMTRAAIFFGIWNAAVFYMNKWSLKQDGTAGVSPTMRLRSFSGPGIVLYPLTATFVLTDWVLSLEPDWYSTMFMVLMVIGQMLNGLAFAIVILVWMRGPSPLPEHVTPTQLHHLGMLLFAFIMLWTYMAFSQMLIIYSGNLPHEIIWYRHRIGGGWVYVAWAIVLFHFAIPFTLLLSRDIKKNAKALGALSGMVLVAHLIDIYWIVEPSFFNQRCRLHWLDIAAVAALGGMWLSVFATRLMSVPLLVRNDPRQHG